MARTKHAWIGVVLWVLTCGRLAHGQPIVIGYTNCLAVTNLSAPLVHQISLTKWFFAHASIGDLIMEGMTNLHSTNGSFYQLQCVPITNVPPTTTNGIIYSNNHVHLADNDYIGDAQYAMTNFQSSVSNGWHYPAVNFAMNMLSFLDIWYYNTTNGAAALLAAYVKSMTNLEAAFPQTTFVYVTMPLTTLTYQFEIDVEPLDGYWRDYFNDSLRTWCATNNRVLYDVADMEAHETNGTICTFTYSNIVCEQLWPPDNQGGDACCGEVGDGAHPTNFGAEEMLARGFYALAAAFAGHNSTTLLTSSTNPAIYSQAVTFTATVGGSNGVPTGTVQFKTNNVNCGPPATLASGTAASTVTNLMEGSYGVSAIYSGDTVFLASTGTLAGGEIVLNPVTVTGLTANNKIYDATTMATLSGTARLAGVKNGDNVTLQGTPVASFASPNAGTGLVVNVSGFTLGGTNAGNYALLEPTLTANIAPAGTSNEVVSSSQPAQLGSAVTLTDTLVPLPPGAGIPTGTVQFLTNGTPAGPPIVLSNAAAAYVARTLPAGTTIITSDYSGDENFLGGSNSISQAVAPWSGSAQLISAAGGTASLTFAGISNFRYLVQRSTNLSDWVTLLATNMPAAGFFQWVDNFQDLGAMPPTAYYRLQQP
jgi:hypothetical protein